MDDVYHVMSITNARRPLFWPPGSNAIELAGASVVADQLEAGSCTPQLTLSVDRNLISSALVR